MGINRWQFMAALSGDDNNTNIVEKITQEAYDLEADQEWRSHLTSSPHGKPWHTSHHASAFPGDDELACPRKSLYTMAGFPPVKPFNRKTKTIMDLGKDIETRVVDRWRNMGVLLAPITNDKQLDFTDPSIWLTGSCDAVLLPEGWKSPHVVEIKTKDDAKVKSMRSGESTFDESHRRQLLTYIYLMNKLTKKIWPHLEPATDGTIYYISRGDPTNTMSYYFNLDKDFYLAGKKALKEWKQFFINDELPARTDDFMWSLLPCKYCDYKRNVCKPDDKAKITSLKDSHGVEWAKEVYGDYDYALVKNNVIGRWSK